ncbi:hypothetical protein P7K49_016055 [Saguinus oedipus]|uniref:Uncharacterized protein n=1 Tax=Saguinus oedipus TaxID=9490 RepID=A0ABQ9VB00_SAGOE|nr:hypothetical protein P7K49_016055 [Saguinus oedipus]
MGWSIWCQRKDSGIGSGNCSGKDPRRVPPFPTDGMASFPEGPLSSPSSSSSSQASAGEVPASPQPVSPIRPPGRRGCLEGPHCNAKEVAMETQAGWCAAG